MLHETIIGSFLAQKTTPGAAEIAGGRLARDGLIAFVSSGNSMPSLPALAPSTPAKQKPASRRAQKTFPPRSSAVGVISLSADMGDSMPLSFDTNF
jgi:hypothetical protein